MLMIGKALTEEQRLSKCTSDIIGSVDYAALVGVLMIGEHGIVEHGHNGVTTAATNGRDSWFSRTFVADLSDAELRFLILHESFHVIYRHMTTYEYLYKADPSRANRACDYVINIKLMDHDAQSNNKGFIKMPACGLVDEAYRDMDSAQVYILLGKKEEAAEPEERSEQGEQTEQTEQTEQGEQGDGTPGGKPDMTPTPGETMDHHDWDGAQALDDEGKKELERDIDEALRQGALLAGKVGSGGDRLVEDLLKSKIDWREALREFVSDTCAGNDYSTWRRPNRRYIGMDVYLPSGVSEAVGELVIAIDTSGSIGAQELRVFLTEVAGICEAVRPSAVRLLYWDTQVCRDEYYTQEQLSQLISSTKPAGGGGTTIECVPEYMTAKSIKPQAVVVLTDGYLGGGWGTWSVPVLWCIQDNKSATPTVGKTVHIESRN